MPLMASVTVASLAATDGGIAAIKSSTPTAPIIAFVLMSTTSGTDYTAHRGEHLNSRRECLIVDAQGWQVCECSAAASRKRDHVHFSYGGKNYWRLEVHFESSCKMEAGPRDRNEQCNLVVLKGFENCSRTKASLGISNGPCSDRHPGTLFSTPAERSVRSRVGPHFRIRFLFAQEV